MVVYKLWTITSHSILLQIVQIFFVRSWRMRKPRIARDVTRV